VSLRGTRSWLATAIFAALIAMISLPATRIWAQDDLPRKVKSRVAPIYPQLARQMNISGMVKVQVTVAANGTVKAMAVMECLRAHRDLHREPEEGDDLRR